MKAKDHSHQSIEQIEQFYWQPGIVENTPMMLEIYNARKKPLRMLSNHEVRLLLAQGEAVNILLPVAITRLEQDILVEASYYPGDLLEALLKQHKDVWIENRELEERFKKLLLENEHLLLSGFASEEITTDLSIAVQAFIKNHL